MAPSRCCRDLRADVERGLVDVLVSVADVVRWWAGIVRQVALCRRNVAVVSPRDVDDVGRAVPEGVELVVVPVERSRAAAEHAALGVMRHVADALDTSIVGKI